MKKEVRKKVETSEKIRDTQGDKGKSKIGAIAPGAPKRAQNGFEKCIGDVLRILTW